MKKNPIMHIDTISVIIDISGETFMIIPIATMIAFNKHPMNAIRADALKLTILILFSH